MISNFVLVIDPEIPVMCRIFIPVLLCITLHSYAQTAGTTSVEYTNEIDAWHQKRVSSLKSENGWLNVSGLYWLKEGTNTLGSGAANDIVFPAGRADEKIGEVILKDSIVSVRFYEGVNVTTNGLLFKEGVIYGGSKEKPVILSHRNLRWFIIKRGNKYGIRLRDLESESLKNFTHIDRYAVDKKWQVLATYEAPRENQTIPIHDVIGLTTATPFGGTLHFEIEGKKYKLDATLEGDDLFIVFSDSTNGHDTYGGGRFLYAKRPVEGNTVALDFNKAYNPPCCFTNYATCPLPPVQNRLSVAVTAGEKVYGHH